MTLECQRERFEIPPDITYLNGAYISPSTIETRRAGERGVARKSHPWEITWSDFFTEADTARTEFARLIGASAEDIAIVPSVSYGIQTAANNLPLGAGQKIVVLADQFPSNFYAWRTLAAERHATVCAVPWPDDWDWTRAVIDAIDRHTGIVALPNCHWSDGTRLDLERVSARCREVSAHLVLDLSQSLGVLPCDVRKVDPDFLVTASYKWLLGPYSLCYMYVAPRWHGGRPLEQNPLSRSNAVARPEWKHGDTPYPETFLPAARRYDVGERANFALLPMSIAALRQLHDWRPTRIAEYLHRLIEHAVLRANALGITVPPAAARSPHMIGMRLSPGVAPDALGQMLERRKIFISVRGQKLRVSPHVYNTLDDIDRLFDAIGELTTPRVG